jgi:hypothetical protein
MVKIAKRPIAIPNSMKTDFSIEVMKNTVMPSRKNVKRNFSFLEYLKYTTLIRRKRNIIFITKRSSIPKKSGLFRLKMLSGMTIELDY